MVNYYRALVLNLKRRPKGKDGPCLECSFSAAILWELFSLPGILAVVEELINLYIQYIYK